MGQLHGDLHCTLSIQIYYDMTYMYSCHHKSLLEDSMILQRMLAVEPWAFFNLNFNRIVVFEDQWALTYNLKISIAYCPLLRLSSKHTVSGGPMCLTVSIFWRSY